MQIPMFVTPSGTVRVAAGGDEKTAAEDAERDMCLFATEYNFIYFFAEIAPIEEPNYKVLLEKYIDHVGLCEGADFLADHHRRTSQDEVKWTDEEWATLRGDS